MTFFVSASLVAREKALRSDRMTQVCIDRSGFSYPIKHGDADFRGLTRIITGNDRPADEKPLATEMDLLSASNRLLKD